MQVDTVVVGEFQVNCHIVLGADSQALVIDPGAEPDLILERLEGRDVVLYILTHGHCDHVSALAALHARLPAPVAMHATDRSWAFSPANCMLPFYGQPVKPDCEERDLQDGQEWTDAGLAWRVIETPGHSPGCVCLHMPEANALFSGDTLFAGSVGRTDLPGGDARALTASLRRLAELPDTTQIYTGHGPETTLLQEKQTNYFMRGMP